MSIPTHPLAETRLRVAGRETVGKSCVLVQPAMMGFFDTVQTRIALEPHDKVAGFIDIEAYVQWTVPSEPQMLARIRSLQTALHDCWAELATEHERNYPLPEPLAEAMGRAYVVLGRPGAGA